MLKVNPLQVRTMYNHLLIDSYLKQQKDTRKSEQETGKITKTNSSQWSQLQISFFQVKPKKITYFLHCLICSGFVYSFRHSVIWSPILIRHCLVCSSCSLSERPFSGRSSCFSAALTGLILSLHYKMQKINVSIQKKKIYSKAWPTFYCDL